MSAKVEQRHITAARKAMDWPERAEQIAELGSLLHKVAQFGADVEADTRASFRELFLRNMPHPHRLIGLWDSGQTPCKECGEILERIGVAPGSMRTVYGIGPKMSGSYFPVATPVDHCGNALDPQSLGWNEPPANARARIRGKTPCP